MWYVKVIDGVVVQRQPYHEDGFISAPDDVLPGYLYDGTAFTAPPPPEPLLSYTITPLEFRNRLTQDERLAIKRSNDDAVEDLITLLNAAEVVDLEADAPDAVDLLIYKGLIAPDRRDTLLAPKVLEI